VSNPSPGTLSNGAASCNGALPAATGARLNGAMTARTAGVSGVLTSTTETPICNGSVQPAASYG
jgi:hypothetical protein